MWVMLNNAFLSIVTPTRSLNDGLGKQEVAGKLLVRARAAGDIAAVFPDAKVVASPLRDYGFRALIPASLVSQAMAAAVGRIDYTNFKDSVSERDRHDAYLDCWMAMNQFQSKRRPPS